MWYRYIKKRQIWKTSSQFRTCKYKKARRIWKSLISCMLRRNARHKKGGQNLHVQLHEMMKYSFKPWSHLRDCRPRLSTTEQLFAIFWQSYSVLRESYGCRRDTYWIRTDTNWFAVSRRQSWGRHDCFKMFKTIVLQSWVLPHTYGSPTAIVLAPTGSYWCVLMRTAILLSRADSYCSLTAVALNRTGSYWYVRQSYSVASIDSSSYLFYRQFTHSSISTPTQFISESL